MIGGKGMGPVLEVSRLTGGGDLLRMDEARLFSPGWPPG